MLTKLAGRAVDPGQAGQPFIPPSHECVTTPPIPPGDGQTPPIGGTPGSDTGSGPGGDGNTQAWPICAYEYMRVCTDGGCQWMAVPTNAPCIPP